MDVQPQSSVEIILVHHQLVKCNAESKIKAAAGKGGTVEFTIEIESPKIGKKIIPDEIFPIILGLNCIGKAEEDQGIAFQASCSIEGMFHIVDCPKEGIMSNTSLWVSPARQILPLVAQFVSDMVSRMGYKNIQIPLGVAAVAPIETVTKTKAARKPRKNIK